MSLKKSSGYVLLVDIDGFGGMKQDLHENEWVPLMNEFFEGCEEVIHYLNRRGEGNGTIIGDGIIIFSETMKESDWLDFSNYVVRDKLLNSFSKSTSNLSIDYLDLTFVIGYCDFYIRKNIDVIGVDIDDLFTICRTAKGNNLLFNSKFYNKKSITNKVRS